MNAPLPALQNPPTKPGPEPYAARAGRNRAEAARSLRDDRAEPARGQSFSNELRSASRDVSRSQPDADHAKQSGADENGESVVIDDSAVRSSEQGEATAGGQQTGQSSESTQQPGGQGQAAGQGQAGGQGQAAASPSQSQQSTAAQSLGLIHVQNAVPNGSATVLFGSEARPTVPGTTDTNQQPVSRDASGAPQPFTGRAAVQAAPAPAAVDQSSSGQSSQSGTTSSPVLQQPIGTAPEHNASPAPRTSTPAANASSAHGAAPSVHATPQQSADAAARHSGDQQPQQHGSHSHSSQLQQKLQQAINESLAHQTSQTSAAQRRAGQVNAAVQFEQTTGKRISTVDTGAAPTITASSAIASTVIDLGATARPGGEQPVVLSSGQPVDESAVTGNVARGLTALVNKRGGVMHMRLEPPELGRVRVQMTMHQGTVSAQFQAATAQAQTVLERNMSVLRTVLERHGLTVERLTVQVQQPSQGQQTAGQQLNDQSADQSGRHQQHDAGGGESRGRGDEHGEHRQRRSFSHIAQEQFVVGPPADARAGQSARAETGVSL